MALSRVKVWIPAEVLTASDLNGEFNNILNNATSLFSPLTGALDVDGNTITLDAAAVTTVTSSAATSWNFTSGAKAGTPATSAGSVANWSAHTFTDSATAGAGTATGFAAHAFQRPTLAATNASVVTTDAATLYVSNAPAAGTNETLTNAYALWTDDGRVRHDLSASIVSAAGATLDALNLTAQTATISGGTNITTATGFNFVKIAQPTLSAASALTITNAATLYIADAPAAGGAGPATITNAYALWVDAGAVRFDGTARFDSTITVIDTSFAVIGSGDATKKVRIEVDGVTTATTRVWTAADIDVAIGKQPTRQAFTSGSGTYTAPSGATRIYVRLVGAGGGGTGSGSAPGAATAGGNTTFSTLTGSGGGAASSSTGGTGGAATGGSVNLAGQTAKTSAAGAANQPGSNGGCTALGGGAEGGTFSTSTAPGAAMVNTGGGGGGAGNAATASPGAGGGGGGYVEAFIFPVSATYSYAVGAAGSGGAAGGSGDAGGNGAAGLIIVDEYYN